MPLLSATEFEEQDALPRNSASIDANCHWANGNRAFSNHRPIDARFEQRALAEQLRTALLRGQLSVEYQGQWNLMTGAITGAEALARWRHNELGNIPPSVFVPLAESDRSIGLLGRHVLSLVLDQLNHWDATGFYIPHVAVNLSPEELNAPQFVDSVTGAVSKAGIASSRIRFEITESIAIQEASDAIHTLRELHDAGFSLAVDDFGTGYSCLSGLRYLPIQTIKIDRSFVRASAIYRSDREILKAIILLAKSLELETIAEGIESADQATLLRDMGCETGQGYYFSHPLSGEAMAGDCSGYASRP
jgi:EAL domain-containing protein (putative c-di-GMP-specific phosphodiesterase class I)